MSRVRTVLGDADPSTLGAVDYHEHLFQVSPLLPGDELDDEARSGEEAAALHAAGIATMVEATPTGLGRRPEAVARISAATGLAVVQVTGAHHGGHYAADDPLLSWTVAELADRFGAEVTDGFRDRAGRPLVGPTGEPIRAGVVKAGIRYWAIGPFERRVLAAAARTHRRTGCPIMVHLDFGSAAHEVLDLLAADGVPASAVALAHIDRNLDPGLHVSLIERGAQLGYDGMARHREAPDSAIIDCLWKVAEQTEAVGILLGGDVARATRYRSYGGLPGLDYLPRRFLPRLRSELSPASYSAIVGGNAARWLTFA
ncbi:phosphotriesterase family protein [Microlunatus soli]|uniref:Phosphotriesterase-related protein n=1 Tax=Microlunatus soli TaxID=630515 RepID=A0A1H1PWF1_9ACTN|nr:aryldialkylphosphatase [Microlunatus soli]SDS15522.1 phosphotriesterase-related protein [Microlunatus soli]